MQREMIDLLERLRDELTINDGIRYYNADIIREAADEIERLRAALKPFAYEYDILMLQQDAFPAWHSVKTAHLREARRALEPKP
jgi:hypothetical protein